MVVRELLMKILIYCRYITSVYKKKRKNETGERGTTMFPWNIGGENGRFGTLSVELILPYRYGLPERVPGLPGQSAP
jgi:hypothetical protein